MARNGATAAENGRTIAAALAAWCLAGCSSAGETGLISGTVAGGDAATRADAAVELDAQPADADSTFADAAPDSAVDSATDSAVDTSAPEVATADAAADSGADVPDDTPDSAPEVVEVPDLSFAQGIGSSPCHFDWSAPKTDAIQLVPWFTKAGLSQPIYLTEYPGPSNRVLVAQRPGQVYLLDNQADTAQKQLVLDLSAKISTAGEGGLLSVALHPQFLVQKKLYVNYTSTGKFATKVSEFSMSAQSPDVVDPASEKVLLSIDQPFSNHNGGQIAFDAAGYLLIGMGDGGSAGDPLGSGQNGLSLLGKMLRIDVNQSSPGKNYAIPPDNPFVGSASVLPEVYALGLRNPWRFSVDPQTGAIWAGDVGQNAWEEIDIIEKGKNYGWNTMEGTHCFSPPTGCKTDGLALPVAELPHGQANSITGGYVYRGKLFPGLYGSYLFSDYVTGKFWSTTSDAASPGGWKTKEVLAAKLAPVSFGRDRDGELFVIQLYPAAIYRIEAAAAPPDPATIPPKLSETGCFKNLQTMEPAAGVVPYELNAPLWSDGAHKRRWLVLPAGTKLQPGQPGPLKVPTDPHGRWDAPVGTLVLKHFALGAGPTPVETRLMRRDPQGWSMFTFRWLADGSDAEVILGGGEQAYPVQVGPQVQQQTWHFPAQSQCVQCHSGSDPKQQLLGPSQAQLDRKAKALGGQNQLKVFGLAGLLSQPSDPNAVAELPDLSSLENGTLPANVDVAAAARAYLHGNCAHCHAPGLNATTALDLRYGTQLAQTKTCGVAPQLGDVGVAGAQVLMPGNPGKSALWLRLSAQPGNVWQMPPVAVNVSHAAAVDLIGKWISGLAACP